MTQYLLSVHDTHTDPPPSEDQIQEMFARVGRFNDDLRASGAWVFAGGLEPPASSTVVDATGSETLVTDGPYAETKEQMGGFWIIEAADLDAALDLASAGSAACGAKVEVRPFQDEPDESA